MAAIKVGDTMCMDRVLPGSCWQLDFIVGMSPRGKAGKMATNSFRLQREGKSNIFHPDYHFISREITLAKIVKIRSSAPDITNVQRLK